MTNDKILVSGSDHNYNEMKIVEIEVVYNSRFKEYFEFFEAKYLTDDETVFIRKVAM